MVEIYLAAGETYSKEVLATSPARMNLLVSYMEVKSRGAYLDPKKFRGYLFDSGAFTFINAGHADKKNIEEYVLQYADYVREHRIHRYFELDLDSIFGYAYTLKLRDTLENRVGWQSIPVWHINRGKQGWIRDLDHPYISIGGLAINKGAGRKYLDSLIPGLAALAHRRDVGVHLLGYTPITGVFPDVESCDSTSWKSFAYCTMYRFTGKRLIGINVKEKGYHVDNCSKLAIPNINAWLHYADYIRQHTTHRTIRAAEGYSE